MAKSKFSETQFVMGFFSEYVNRIRALGTFNVKPFLFPTTVQEPIVASDLIIHNLKGLDFFQFKRSDCFKKRRGKAEIKAGLPEAFKPYYRFKIYNEGKFPQFDRLRLIAQTLPHSEVYYCAPKFHTHYEFQQLFWKQEIIKNSAIIDCNQFNSPGFNLPSFNINDGHDHFVVYNKSKIGYMCSKIKEIKLTDLNSEISRTSKTKETLNTAESQFPSEEGSGLVNVLFRSLSSDNYSYGDLNEFENSSLSVKLNACANHLLIKYNTILVPKFSL